MGIVEKKKVKETSKDTSLQELVVVPTRMKKNLDLWKVLEEYGVFETGVVLRQANSSEISKKDFEARIVEFENKNKNSKKAKVDSDTLTIYEISFLDRMLSGEFNNVTENFFELKTDKDLFNKYFKMSKDQQEKKHKEYIGKMKTLYAD